VQSRAARERGGRGPAFLLPAGTRHGEPATLTVRLPRLEHAKERPNLTVWSLGRDTRETGQPGAARAPPRRLRFESASQLKLPSKLTSASSVPIKSNARLAVYLPGQQSPRVLHEPLERAQPVALVPGRPAVLLRARARLGRRGARTALLARRAWRALLLRRGGRGRRGRARAQLELGGGEGAVELGEGVGEVGREGAGGDLERGEGRGGKLGEVLDREAGEGDCEERSSTGVRLCGETNGYESERERRTVGERRPLRECDGEVGKVAGRAKVGESGVALEGGAEGPADEASALLDELL